MSDSSASRHDVPQGRGPVRRDERRGDPDWLRPTLTFLLGLLVGALVIAATRPLGAEWPSIGTNVTSTNLPSCDQVLAESQRLADLAARAARAARTQDSTTLTEVVLELDHSQRTLADDALGCHR